MAYQAGPVYYQQPWLEVDQFAGFEQPMPPDILVDIIPDPKYEQPVFDVPPIKQPPIFDTAPPEPVKDFPGAGEDEPGQTVVINADESGNDKTKKMLLIGGGLLLAYFLFFKK